MKCFCRLAKNARECWAAWPAVLLALAAISPLHAAELAASTGATDSAFGTSYAWQIEYRERLLESGGVSLGYLNEGHLLGHHRDGVSAQAWAAVPVRRHRLELAFGLGPYIYCDTQPEGTQSGYRDYHAVGMIATVSLTWRWQRRWIARLSLNEIHAPANVDTRTLLLGVGYRTGGPPDGAGEEAYQPRNELDALVGQTIVNSLQSGRSMTYAVEYRRRVARFIDISGAWLRDSQRADGRHSGVMGEVWLVKRFLGNAASVGLGVGPYAALESYRTGNGALGTTVEGTASITVSWRLAHALAARLEWHRSFTHDDQDCDIVLAGLAWSWGG